MGWVVTCAVVCATSYALPTFRPQGGLPSALVPTPLTGGLVGAKSFQQSLSFTQLSFRQVEAGPVQVSLEGARALLQDGMPRLPVSLRQMALPLGKTARVTLENVVIEESAAAVAFERTPEALVWGPNMRLDFGEASGRYFPGKLVSSSVSEGVLYISVYPVQWDRQSGRAIVVRRADLRVEISDGLRDIVIPNPFAPPAILLTSERLRAGAELIREHHQSLGVNSTIVTVEEISRLESAADLEVYPPGYKTGPDTSHAAIAYDPEEKKGYDFDLARKVKRYLDKQMATGSPLRYVTILGDADVVPPSYYFAVGLTQARKYGVTDMCYGAVAKCMEPKAAVGRLPFHTLDEVKNHIEKTKRWLEYAPTAPSELALYGGKAFPGDVHIGEMGTLRTVTQPEANWRGLKKYFLTHQSYAKPGVLQMVEGNRPSAMLYYLDHGNGNQWYVENDYVSTNDVLAINDRGSYASPLVVSIACTNAAFDEEMAAESVLSAHDGDIVVGAALLKSKAGAVAYLGSSRPALGVPIYQTDAKGNVEITGASYGLQMFDTFFERYRKQGGGRLGDIVLKMFRAYLNENGNDMSNERNIWTYFNVALLGDPVLRLPDRSSVDKSLGLARSTSAFEPEIPGGFPKFAWAEGKALQLAFEAASPVHAVLMRTPRNPFGAALPEVIGEKDFASGGGTWEVPLKGDQLGLYLLRLENAEGVPFERRVQFNVRK